MIVKDLTPCPLCGSVASIVDSDAPDAQDNREVRKGIDVEVAECDLFDARAVAAVSKAARLNPHLFR